MLINYKDYLLMQNCNNNTIININSMSPNCSHANCYGTLLSNQPYSNITGGNL